MIVYSILSTNKITSPERTLKARTVHEDKHLILYILQLQNIATSWQSRRTVQMFAVYWKKKKKSRYINTLNAPQVSQSLKKTRIEEEAAACER